VVFITLTDTAQYRSQFTRWNEKKNVQITQR